MKLARYVFCGMLLLIAQVSCMMQKASYIRLTKNNIEDNVSYDYSERPCELCDKTILAHTAARGNERMKLWAHKACWEEEHEFSCWHCLEQSLAALRDVYVGFQVGLFSHLVSTKNVQIKQKKDK